LLFYLALFVSFFTAGVKPVESFNTEFIYDFQIDKKNCFYAASYENVTLKKALPKYFVIIILSWICTFEGQSSYMGHAKNKKA
jgi:hypothetical protein